MKARRLCPYGDGSPSSRCRCTDMTAAWFHGAAKKPLVVSVYWNGTVSPFSSTITTVYCRSCFVPTCLNVWVWSACSWTYKQVELQIYLYSVFPNNFRRGEREGERWSKSGKRGNKSVRVCLPCWFEMKAHCATSSTLKSEMSLLASPKKKTSTLSWSFIFSLFLFSLTGSNWRLLFFGEIKEDFRLTWTFRN